MPIPPEIKALKPTCFGAVELRQYKDGYYVYRISSKWDPEKGRSKKVTGLSMGKITLKDGFVPNANGMREMQKEGTLPKTQPVVKNYGAYETLQQISPNIEEGIKKYFPDSYREIKNIALLRLVDGITSQHMVKPAFLSSYLSDISPDIAISDTSVRNFIASLGTKEAQINAFMRTGVNPNATLLFDGTTIFTKGKTSFAQKGYNPEHKQDTQARILYIFECDTHKPVFYRVLQGSIVDKSAFVDTVKLSGSKNCTIVADKGFYSKNNISALIEAGLKFILPLQSNTSYVDEGFYRNSDDRKFDGAFLYHERLIWYKKSSIGNKNNIIYTFRDDSRKDRMRASIAKELTQNNAYATFTADELIGDERCGYFSFISNIDTEPNEIYLKYKERWDIEQCFDYMKNSVSSSASHAQTDDYFKGWAFLNHISLLYFYGLLNRLCEAKLNVLYSPGDVIDLTKNIFLVNYGDTGMKQVSSIQKRTQEILDALGINLLR